MTSIEQIRSQTNDAFHTVTANQKLTHCAFLVSEEDAMWKQDSTAPCLFFEACDNVLNESVIRPALRRNT